MADHDTKNKAKNVKNSQEVVDAVNKMEKIIRGILKDLKRATNS